MRRVGLAVAFGVLAVWLPGCQPDLGDPESLITRPQILAIVSNPPEAKPGESVSLRSLAVDAHGTEASQGLTWSFCVAPKPLTENNTVSNACLGDSVWPIGGPSAAIDATVPLDACALFGPDTPPGNSRPRDADPTGGFYQPVRAVSGALTAFFMERILCNLPSAPTDVAIALAKTYQRNNNPVLTALSLSIDGAPVLPDRVPRGQTIALEIGWGDGDAETYWMFDPDRAALVERREALRVSWFVTGGTLGDEETGRGEQDPATTTSTTWTAPEESARVNLWVVLRDSRGGVDFAGYDLALVP